METELSTNQQKTGRFPRYDGAVLGFRNYWYPVMFSHRLRKKPVSFKVLGENVVFVRDSKKVFALQDRCAHRGIPLSAGVRLSPGTITCRYHGWTYDLESGKLIAALTDTPDSAICGKANVAAYPVEERAGLIWIYVGDGDPPPVEVDIPSELLDPEIVIEGIARVQRGNWRTAMENGMDEAHARFLHRTGPWTLFREIAAWNTFEQSLSDDSEPWVVRRFKEVKWQDQYDRVGAWPPKHFLQRRRKNARQIAGRLPCILRNGSKGGLTLYNWWVPVDEDHYVRLMTMTLPAKGFKALRFRLWFWLYARWVRLILFSNQDQRMIELTNTPPERLFGPDVSITYWRRYCETHARGAE